MSVGVKSTMARRFGPPATFGKCAFLLLLALDLAAHPCQSCHPKEVAAYSHSSMARSLRSPGNEPQGTFTSVVSGTRFTIRSDAKGTWQRMERFGGSAEYRVAYVIGSGNHASGYLIQVGGRLAKSAFCVTPGGRSILQAQRINTKSPRFSKSQSRASGVMARPKSI